MPETSDQSKQENEHNRCALMLAVITVLMLALIMWSYFANTGNRESIKSAELLDSLKQIGKSVKPPPPMTDEMKQKLKQEIIKYLEEDNE